jgi:hypothetical protein
MTFKCYFHTCGLLWFPHLIVSSTMSNCKHSSIPPLATFMRWSSQIQAHPNHRGPISVRFAQIDLHSNRKTWRVTEVHSLHFHISRILTKESQSSVLPHDNSLLRLPFTQTTTRTTLTTPLQTLGILLAQQWLWTMTWLITMTLQKRTRVVRCTL